MTCDEDREVLGSQPSALAIEDLRSGDPWPGGRHLAPPVPPDRSAKSLKSHERLRGSLLAVTRKRDGTGHRGAGRHRRAHPAHQLPQGVPRTLAPGRRAGVVVLPRARAAGDGRGRPPVDAGHQPPPHRGDRDQEHRPTWLSPDALASPLHPPGCGGVVRLVAVNSGSGGCAARSGAGEAPTAEGLLRVDVPAVLGARGAQTLEALGILERIEAREGAARVLAPKRTHELAAEDLGQPAAVFRPLSMCQVGPPEAEAMRDPDGTSFAARLAHEGMLDHVLARRRARTGPGPRCGRAHAGCAT